MAYGQTSAGKTHTIVGEMEEQIKNAVGMDSNDFFQFRPSLRPITINEKSGILPRFLRDLFEKGGDQIEVKCSFFEIYNELIYDLLGNRRDFNFSDFWDFGDF